MLCIQDKTNVCFIFSLSVFFLLLLLSALLSHTSEKEYRISSLHCFAHIHFEAFSLHCYRLRWTSIKQFSIFFSPTFFFLLMRSKSFFASDFFFALFTVFYAEYASKCFIQYNFCLFGEAERKISRNVIPCLGL